MDAIAAAARVSKVTLYARFPDKESLLRAVVEDRAAAWSAAADKQDWMPGPGHTLNQRLKHYMTVAMTWAVEDEVRAFDRVLAGAPVHVARVLYELRYNYMVDFLAEEIEQFTRSDTKGSRSPRQVAFDLMALVTGWFHMQSMVGVVSKRKAVEYGHHAVEVVMAAQDKW
jgi:AcrR family transcriptional regulator